LRTSTLGIPKAATEERRAITQSKIGQEEKTNNERDHGRASPKNSSQITIQENIRE
jgi:hypothetical protein